MEHLQNVQKLFSDRLFRIPDYQRGYAWGKPQLDDFLDDLEVLENGHEHYTGTLVIYPSTSSTHITDEDGNGLDCFDVVDGQQRLTTIVLLLDCVRRALTGLKVQGTVASGIRKRYISTRDIEGQERPKLTLNSDTHPYFMRRVIAEQPGIDGPRIRSEERLQIAHDYFSAYLREKQAALGAEYCPWLIELVQRVTLRLQLTVYEVPNATDVGMIFEVMNNRGKPLSEMEKVKNYLLYVATKISMDAGARLGESINSAWSDMFARLMAANAAASTQEDQLLRSHWLMAYNYNPREWAGSKSVKVLLNLKQYMGKEGQLVAELNSYVESLRSFCVAYCDIANPARTDAFSAHKKTPKLWRELVRWGTKLVRLESLASFIPILAAVRFRLPDDGEAYLRTLKLCECYAFRVFRAAERRANAGQSALFRAGHELFHSERSLDESLDRIATNLLWYAPEEEFAVGLDKVENWYEWYGIKYFLYEYEEHLAADREIVLPWDDLVRRDKKETIEHILPQTPTDPYWARLWSAEQIERYLHDVGNLSLTQDNSSYGNSAFPKKKGRTGDPPPCYSSGLRMEQQLVRYADWNEGALLDRREELISWARGRWHVDSPGTATPVVDDPSEDDGLASP